MGTNNRPLFCFPSFGANEQELSTHYQTWFIDLDENPDPRNPTKEIMKRSKEKAEAAAEAIGQLRGLVWERL